jgi:hypothetical protein
VPEPPTRRYRSRSKRDQLRDRQKQKGSGNIDEADGGSGGSHSQFVVDVAATDIDSGFGTQEVETHDEASMMPDGVAKNMLGSREPTKKSAGEELSKGQSVSTAFKLMQVGDDEDNLLEEGTSRGKETQVGGQQKTSLSFFYSHLKGKLWVYGLICRQFFVMCFGEFRSRFGLDPHFGSSHRSSSSRPYKYVWQLYRYWCLEKGDENAHKMSADPKLWVGTTDL